MSNVIEEKDIVTINESQVPSIIGSQMNALAELDKKVKRAVNMAAQAKGSAEKAQIGIRKEKWNDFKAGERQKQAIEMLQKVVGDLSEANISISEAQKISFDYQTKLTEITKYLFGLGVSNLAMNRSVVKALGEALDGKSEIELSDLTKQEIENVIFQLKQQEDMLKKTEDLQSKVGEQELELERQRDKDEEHDEKFEAMSDKDKEHDELIEANAQKISDQESELERQRDKDKEHDELIGANAKKILAQESELERQRDKDEEHDEKFEAMSDKDKEHDRLISENADKIVIQEKELAELKSRIAVLEVAASKKTLKIATFAIASVSLIIDILQILGVI